MSNEYTPDVVFPPGRTILEMLHLQGKTVEELADSMGYTESYMQKIIQGDRLDEDTARNLETKLGGTIEFWNVLEAHYRGWLLATGKAIKPLTDALDRCGIPYHVENGGKNVLFGCVFVTRTQWGFFRVLAGSQVYESNEITDVIEWAFRRADDETRNQLGYK